MEASVDGDRSDDHSQLNHPRFNSRGPEVKAEDGGIGIALLALRIWGFGVNIFHYWKV